MRNPTRKRQTPRSNPHRGRSLSKSSARTSIPSGPLSGIRILDLTRLLPGGYCTQMLADLGAEVIKIEQPGAGDYWRHVGLRVREQSCQFLALNRGKKSITLDLKHPDGREAFLRLCETADVVVEGFRPGVMTRLKLDASALHARNPRLVICAITGFGQDGPWAQLAAHDLNYLGLTGVLHYANGTATRPRATALPIGDVGAGGLMAVNGILAGLLECSRTGKGRSIDVSVADGLFSWVSFMTARWNVPGHADVDVPFDAPFDKPFYSVYETKDGRHLVTGAYEPKFWKTLCEVLQIEEWVDRQWADGAEEDELRRLLASKFAAKPLAEWMEIFAIHEACVTPVLTIKEALETTHAVARGTVVTVEDPAEGKLREIACPLRFDGVTFGSRTPAPSLGQDSDSLLREVGYGARDIQKMKSSGAV
ncbi:MAG: CaiB/BaiF CoA transferase family protein [Alphaproteobacteria bacterium]